jgi:6-phosphogluconate dehydrogenase
MGSDVGLYGLAVMGQNFALNMASKGFSVSVCNRSHDKVRLLPTPDVRNSAPS